MPPELLLTALLIQALYWVRSGRQLMKRLATACYLVLAARSSPH